VVMVDRITMKQQYDIISKPVYEKAYMTGYIVGVSGTNTLYYIKPHHSVYHTTLWFYFNPNDIIKIANDTTYIAQKLQKEIGISINNNKMYLVGPAPMTVFTNIYANEEVKQHLPNIDTVIEQFSTTALTKPGNLTVLIVHNFFKSNIYIPYHHLDTYFLWKRIGLSDTQQVDQTKLVEYKKRLISALQDEIISDMKSKRIIV